MPGAATPPPGAGQAWLRGQVVCPAPSPSLSCILALDPFRKNRHFGFCPVQFREYSFSDFPGTKNSRKQAAGTVALVNRLVQEIIRKVLQSVEKHKKVDKTKHGTSKIIDTFAMYQHSQG